MVLKSRLLVIIILLLTIASCQKENESVSLNTESNSKEQKSLIDSIRVYLYTNPGKVIPFINRFKDISHERNQIGNVTMAYASLGVAYDIRDEIDKCLENNYRALSLCETSDCIINIKLTIAEVYEKRYNYGQALILLEESYQLAKKEKNEESSNSIEQTIALINSKIGSPEKAVKILEKAYKNIKEGIDERAIRITRRNLIEVYLKSKKPDSALKLIEIAIADAKSINNEELQYYLSKFQSESYLQKEILEQAKASAQQALLLAQSLENNGFIIEASYLLALIYKAENNLNISVLSLENELKYNQTNIPETLSKCYLLLAENYDILNNSTKSSFYYKKHKEEQDKIKNKRVSTLNKTHALSLKELNSEKIEQERKKRYWIIAFGISLCASLLIFIYNKKTQKRNKKRFDDLMLKVDAHEKENKSDNTIKSKIEEDEVSVLDETHSVYIIDDEKINEILLKLKNLEDQHYFLRQDCTLHNMAKRLKTNTSYLSKVVNNHLNKTFSNYINELRVNYAIIELKQNKQLRAYSTKAIAQELGYKKANSFSKYFKEATGITPAVYIKNIKERS